MGRRWPVPEKAHALNASPFANAHGNPITSTPADSMLWMTCLIG